MFEDKPSWYINSRHRASDSLEIATNKTMFSTCSPHGYRRARLWPPKRRYRLVSKKRIEHSYGPDFPHAVSIENQPKADSKKQKQKRKTQSHMPVLGPVAFFWDHDFPVLECASMHQAIGWEESLNPFQKVKGK